ncbi:MAG: nucleotidyltransferase family protein [Bacillota bacterium]|nr:nucleotidyltransferase family protein [Bacillota bacterium]
MPRSRLIGIYLAAGRSSRMGVNKLELPFKVGMLGSLGFSAALDSRLNETIAVTRRGDPLHWLAPFSQRKGWTSIECAFSDLGLSESLKAGVRKAQEMDACGVMVMLADQPFVDAVNLNRLIDAYTGKNVVSAFDGRLCKPPVLFPEQLFPDLLKLEGDEGARAILRCMDGTVRIPFPLWCFRNFDTPEDYQSIVEVNFDADCWK